MLILLVWPASAARAAHVVAGDPDPNFGTNGVAQTDLGAIDLPSAIVVQPDDKIVIAGATGDGAGHNRLGLVRYSSRGLPDESFATHGVFLGVQGFYPNGMVLQPDGKLVVVGAAPGADGANVGMIVRLDTSGALDPTFGTNGVAQPLSGRSVWMRAAIEPDGKIVLAGQLYDAATLMRLNADGSLDSSFGQGGVTQFLNGMFKGLVLMADGRIMGAQSDSGSPSLWSLARALPDGRPDTTFGGSPGHPGFGYAGNLAGDGSPPGLLLQPDGKLIVFGAHRGDNGLYDVVMYRLLMMDGVFTDSSFGSSGRVTTDLGANELPTDALVQSDGKIVVVGSRVGSGGGDYLVLRYNPTGSPDTSFGVNGAVTVASGGLDLRAVALQSTGRIVAGGLASNGVNADFMVTRFYGATGPSSPRWTIPRLRRQVRVTVYGSTDRAPSPSTSTTAGSWSAPGSSIPGFTTSSRSASARFSFSWRSPGHWWGSGDT